MTRVRINTNTCINKRMHFDHSKRDAIGNNNRRKFEREWQGEAASPPKYFPKMAPPYPKLVRTRRSLALPFVGKG